ncbi:MAG: PDZ domain-containing protein [Planctomycetes bacterium]|nr:PDZ domain-containing protein [Planctomycetota bacterium]
MSELRTAALVTILGALGLAPLMAQGDTPAPKPASGTEAEGRRSAEDLIGDLGDDSFRARLEAERSLRALGEAALPALRKAAESSTDHEVQWRARRLIRQIERGDSRGLVQRGQDDVARPRTGSLPRDGLQGDFDQFFREMEQRFGLDIPRARFFHDDFFRDLQEQMQATPGASRGMSMQIGPDGAVRVEIEETDAEGKSEQKVYEAPDMESFRAQYPDVLERGGLGGIGLRLWSDVDPMAQPFLRLQRGMAPLGGRPQPGFELLQPVPAPDLANRLGVSVRPEIPAELREHLELADGQGLMVQGVAEGSLASELGLRVGDIVLRVGGEAVGAPADVQAALARIAAGDEVAVTFLRKGSEQVAKAKKPQPPAQQDAAPVPGGKQLQRRHGADDGAKVR